MVGVVVRVVAGGRVRALVSWQQDQRTVILHYRSPSMELEERRGEERGREGKEGRGGEEEFACKILLPERV